MATQSALGDFEANTTEEQTTEQAEADPTTREYWGLTEQEPEVESNAELASHLIIDLTRVVRDAIYGVTYHLLGDGDFDRDTNNEHRPNVQSIRARSLLDTWQMRLDRDGYGGIAANTIRETGAEYLRDRVQMCDRRVITVEYVETDGGQKNHSQAGSPADVEDPDRPETGTYTVEKQNGTVSETFTIEVDDTPLNPISWVTDTGVEGRAKLYPGQKTAIEFERSHSGRSVLGVDDCAGIGIPDTVAKAVREDVEAMKTYRDAVEGCEKEREKRQELTFSVERHRYKAARDWPTTAVVLMPESKAFSDQQDAKYDEMKKELDLTAETRKNRDKHIKAGSVPGLDLEEGDMLTLADLVDAVENGGESAGEGE